MSTSAITNPTTTPQRRGHGRRESDLRHEHLTRLLSAVPEGIICLNRDWLITFANEEAFRQSTVTPSDVHTRTFWDVYPYLIDTALDRAYRSVMQSGQTEQIEYYCDVNKLWIDIHICPTEEGLALYYQDISDRKRAEAHRDASVRQLQQVLEATTDAVLSVNRDWIFTFANRRAAELLHAKGDLIGKNMWEEFPPHTPESDYYVSAQRAMNERIAGDFEIFYPAPLNLWLAIQVRPSDDGIVIFFRDITARRESEQVLRQQQELLSVVQQAALVATWDIDLTTGKVTFGPGSYPIAGHPLTNVPSLDAFKRIVLPAHIPLLDRAIQSAITTGELIVLDLQILATDGSLVWVENRAQAVTAEGQPPRLRGMSIDVTARKKDEQALRASEARYRVLADLNPNAIWMGTSAGETTYANQGLLDYIGLNAETPSNTSILEAIHPDDRERLLNAWMQAASTGAELDVEARIMRASDNRPRWWWMRAQPIRDESGEVLHWLAVGIDIDDRKTFADALQQRQEETERQRAELETIYQTAPIGLALFDPVDFRYLRINDRQVETIGLPKEQILGRPITEIAPLKGLRELFQQVASGHPIRNHMLEGELPSRPGEHRYWNVSYSPVPNPDGSVAAIAAVVLEITNQKKAEAALIQSEKLAAVGRLASSISHEINNPLEAITNLLYLIALADELPDTLRHYVQTAQGELSRVCQIATQTLRFHRQAVRASYVCAADLVGAVLHLYHGRLANSSIHVDVNYATDTTIFCFENDIRQVLNNLIANSIDAMRQGGRLVVRAHDATDHPTGRKGIRITIADTGHGMSPAVQRRIFEPFYTTKDLNGTGLGLWISTGIVHRHQGRLTFRSSNHPFRHGSVFSLFLPWAEVPSPELADTADL